MLKALYRVLSGFLWSLGFERLSMKLLLLSLEMPQAVFIEVPNKPEPPEVKVIYVDKEALAELGPMYNNDIAPVRSVLDVN